MLPFGYTLCSDLFYALDCYLFVFPFKRLGSFENWSKLVAGFFASPASGWSKLENGVQWDLDLHCLNLSLYLRLLHRRSEVVRLLHRVNPQIMLWCLVHRRGLRKKAMSKLA